MASKKLRIAGCGCLIIGFCVLLLFALEILGGRFLFKEDLSDIRFSPLCYVGRTCRGLEIKTEPWGNPDVIVTNNRKDAIRKLRVTTKYFGRDGRIVVEWTHDVLESGQSVTFECPPEARRLDLGMIYVRVRCDRGVAIEHKYWSYWD